MSEQEIRDGLSQGRRLCQEEWARGEEIEIVDKMVAEGFAVATPWEYHGNFQCERRYVYAAARGGAGGPE